MKASKLRLLPTAILILAIGLVIGYASPGYGAHTGGPVILKDMFGSSVTGNAAYSPKTTCGTTACHDQYLIFRGLTGVLGNVYEGSPAMATKDHGPGTPSYDVPYPQHGVSAGYHFQQGRNISWDSSNNNAQRSFYGLPKFTSSPGMYGKF